MTLIKRLQSTLIICLIAIILFELSGEKVMACKNPEREAWHICCAACGLLAFWPAAVVGCIAGCTIGYLTTKCGGPLTKSSQSTYQPRFNPETILYNHGDVVLLRAGRYDCQTSQFLSGIGNVPRVEFYVVDFTNYSESDCWESVSWQLIGEGSFDETSSMWYINWPTSFFPTSKGFALRVVFYDSAEGPLDGVGAAGVREVVPAIPSLTEWGRIGLVIALLATTTWVFFWRRKVITKGIS